MRLFVAVMFLTLLPVILRAAPTPPPSSEGSWKSLAPYDPNPAHIWNRLADALLVREGPLGTKYGAESLDPLLWRGTKHLLEARSHKRAISVLDEFLQTHAENLIRDPVKRAVLQRDLWAVFDWSVQGEPEDEAEHGYKKERQELQIRLAEGLRRLALTPQEIESLPDNYGQAVASGAFATEYDPVHRDRAFLPPDLFQPRGPWVCIHGNFEFGPQPVAIQHVFEFSGRSRFLVFVRLPGGRKSTYEYLQTLWDFPQPWIPRDPTGDQVVVNRALPQFPAGTQVALVRQMTLFDSHGNLAPAPITESVQIRVYRTIATGKEEHFEGSDVAARSGQDFYEIILSRPQLFVNQAGGLRATGRDEREFPIFQTQGEDPFEPLAKNLIPRRLETEPIFLRCAICHSAGGINSLNSRRRLLKPNSLQHDSADGYPPRWWENDETVQWKQDRYDWGLLNGYWKLGEGSH